MTAGLIVNPHSGRGGRGLGLTERLKCSPVRIAILDTFAALPGILRDQAEAGVDTLFISSGDGTIHAIQGELAERSPFAKPPRLVLLPHGTTNMTAADLGLRIADPARLAPLIRDAEALSRATTVKTRPTIKVANAADGEIRHGMFLGTGGIWRGVKFCHDRVHAAGLKGDWATAVTLAAGLGRALFGRATPDEDRLDRPHHMHVEADGETVADGLQVVFFATTLDRLILATRPFWGGARAPLRATVIAHPPPSLLWTRRVLYGGEDRRVPPQCCSFAAREIAISVSCRFVMDGESFDASADAPLKLETGPSFTYVCSP